MLVSRKRSTPLLLLVTFTCILLFYRRHNAKGIYKSSWVFSGSAGLARAPANRTLGFGAVVVVSKRDSERRHSLVQAANVTDVELTIPSQPQWSEDDMERFLNGQEQDLGQKGSVLAWLGHSNVLHWFLESGLETALILEDDVDWDFRLRSVQIPLAAGAIRQLLPSMQSWHLFGSLFRNRERYWGDHHAWDLLYLGHCGDYFDMLDGNNLKDDMQLYNLSAMHHILYQDPTLPSRLNLHPFTQQLFNRLRLPEQSRVLHRSKFPLCSFGYAITRHAALRLLEDLAPPQYSEDGPRAYDVALLDACRKGAMPDPSPPRWEPVWPHMTTSLPHQQPSAGLRCWTLNSELFHHMPGRSQIAEIGEMLGEEPGIPPVDLAAQAQVAYRNETTNIDCGFWNGAFAFDDGDANRLHILQEQVGRQGRCMKEGKEVIEYGGPY